jgi:hypothetical protein
MGDVTEEVLTQLSLRRSKRILAKGLRSGEIIPENFSPPLWINPRSLLLLQISPSSGINPLSSPCLFQHRHTF